jgi:hypothetical protein
MMLRDHARRMYEAAAADQRKDLWIADTGGHGSAFAGARAEYLRRVRQLVDPQAD